jgi:hypothetical protein
VRSSWYPLYLPQARIPNTSNVYPPMGSGQDKWKPDGSVGTGLGLWRWESTAFALDYYGALIR